MALSFCATVSAEVRLDSELRRAFTEAAAAYREAEQQHAQVRTPT